MIVQVIANDIARVVPKSKQNNGYDNIVRHGRKVPVTIITRRSYKSECKRVKLQISYGSNTYEFAIDSSIDLKEKSPRICIGICP